MFPFIKIKLKQTIAFVSYLILELWTLVKKKEKLKNSQKIVILFLRNLGIGDLVMLSPAIQEIANLFPNSKISLVTWVPAVINFDNIDYIKPEELDFKNVDLVISPTLNLRHIPYIFKAKNFIGYFAWTKIQSNLRVKKFGYKLQGEHYLWRGVSLIKSLDIKLGNRMENDFHNHSIVYPKFFETAPKDFDLYKGYRYLAIAPVSKWLDRQWPFDNFLQVIGDLLKESLIERVIILGDASKNDKEFISRLLNCLGKDFPKYLFIDASGNDLKESIFIIKNSSLFIGLDSAPAHFAYLVARKVLSIFITVDPLWRVPVSDGLGEIKCILPINPNFKVYSGLASANFKKVKKYVKSISVERVLKGAKELLTINL